MSKRVHQAFLEVAACAPAERSAALDRHCGTDAALREEVERLLLADHEAAGFMSRPTLADAMEQALPSAPLTAIGPYTIIQQIGEGTFGDVYLATQEQPLRRTVAIKVIKLGMDTRQVVARFVQESQALALMNHPHISRVLDAGATETGRPYFVMEVVEGRPITAFADEHTLGVRARIELFVQVCNAVEHAHSRGVVHRDLKPGNVLASIRDGHPFAKVIDFGIAKATGAVGGLIAGTALVTDHRQLIGTPEYMSPEQAEGSPEVGTATDVYALGVLLYELLTGLLPYPGDKLRSVPYAEMQRMIIEEEPPLPSARLSREAAWLPRAGRLRGVDAGSLIAAVRGDLDWVIMRAIEKAPQRRYASPAALAEDLGRYLAGDPVIAAPPSTVYRMRKYVRKRRKWVIAGSAVGCVLLLGAAATLWQARARVAQTRKAEAMRLVALSKEAGTNAPQRRVLLAVEAVATTASTGVLPECKQALLDALAEIGGIPLCGHTGPVIAAVFSPDGARVLTASADGTARLWRLVGTERVELECVLRGHEGGIESALFSPDGSSVITASEDGTARVWSVVAPTASATLVLRGHHGRVNTAEFSPDGRFAVTAGSDGTARVWDLWSADPSEHPRIFEGHMDQVRSATMSPDGQRLLTASYDGSCRLWDLKDAQSTRGSKAIINALGWVRRAVFSPDGCTVAIAAGGQFAWSVADAQPQPLGDHLSTRDPAVALAVAFSPDGTRLAVGCFDRMVRVFSLSAQPSVAPPLVLRGHDAPPTCVAFSGDGSHLLSAAPDHTARVWDLTAPNPGATALVLRGHDQEVRAAAFSPDGTRVVTASDDGTARVWNIAGVNPTRAFRSFGSKGVDILNTSELSPDGTMVAIMGDFPKVELWSVTNGARLADVPRGYSEGAKELTSCFHPDSHALATVREAEVTIWDLPRPTEPSPRLRFDTGMARLRTAAFAPDGVRLATLHIDGSVCLWDLSAGAPPTLLWRWDLSAPLHTLRCAFNRAGTRLLVFGDAYRVALLDVDRGTEVPLPQDVLSGSEWLVAAAFAPDGSRIATGGADRMARIWNMQDADPAHSVIALPGHADWVCSTEFSPDGQELLTASYDGTARVWTLGEPDVANASLVLRVGCKLVGARCFPEASAVLLARQDGIVEVWDLRLDALCALARRAIGRDLTREEWASIYPQQPYQASGKRALERIGDAR